MVFHLWRENPIPGVGEWLEVGNSFPCKRKYLSRALQGIPKNKEKSLSLVKGNFQWRNFAFNYRIISFYLEKNILKLGTSDIVLSSLIKTLWRIMAKEKV